MNFPLQKWRISKSFGSSEFWDSLGGQVLVMIGPWYSRQPLTNHKVITLVHPNNPRSLWAESLLLDIVPGGMA